MCLLDGLGIFSSSGRCQGTVWSDWSSQRWCTVLGTLIRCPSSGLPEDPQRKEETLVGSCAMVPGFLPPPSVSALSLQIPARDLPRLIFATIRLAQVPGHSREITQTSGLHSGHLPCAPKPNARSEGAGGEGGGMRPGTVRGSPCASSFHPHDSLS